MAGYEALPCDFHQSEKQLEGRDPVSKVVWGKICEYNRIYDPYDYTSPYTSIVGPSGIGKSFCTRSIAAANHAYVIYVSFTDPCPKLGTYPPRSSISKWLLDTQWYYDNPSARITTRFECFIASSIIQVQACRRYEISPIDFYEIQVNSSKTEYQWFRETMQFHIKDLEHKASTSQEECNDFRSGFDSVYDKGDAKYITKHLDEFSRDIDAEFQRMAKYTKRSPDMPRGEPSVFFYFDDASGLICPVDDNDLTFRCLRRALRRQKLDNKKEDLFGVLIDKIPRYNPYVPRSKPDPHFKLLKEPRLTFDPIFELSTFDSLSRIKYSGIGTQESSVKVDPRKLYTLGRPLWRVYTSRLPPYRVVTYAMGMLYGAKSYYKLGENVLTSMMAVRVPIDILQDHLANTLVADHLRMIYDIKYKDERLVMSTIQPSEPVLAWAATQEAEHRDAKLKILYNMRKQLKLGHIDIGNVCEMAACLILLYPFDKTQDIYEAPKSVRFTTFLRSLFGQETFENHAHEHESSYDSGLINMWEGGYVFFTHFTRLDTDIDEHVLRHAWIRGCGLITVPNTHHFNLAIPVLIDDQLQCLLIQVTNGKDYRMGSSPRDDATHAMNNARKSLSSKGVDACAFIYMALRTKSATSVAFDLSHQSRRKSSMGRARKDKDTGGYVILACGLDENIYPGLTRNTDECREIATELRELLSIKDNEKNGNQTVYPVAVSMRRN
ncbi:hypothetical protein ZTR_09676 [Talaromyces verruculosus]|nr:hypothetical protein ZTR_09676 [Talaromyces verruculosus]